ncbi:hypothetical protein R1flu_000261 [Riccia fluitans]|uniref:Uncharacterized protein n=1 Tax=Riccia fluitans TaxID=41844 RepID=A0ABD1Y0B2_9MARC
MTSAMKSFVALAVVAAVLVSSAGIATAHEGHAHSPAEPPENAAAGLLPSSILISMLASLANAYSNPNGHSHFNEGSDKEPSICHIVISQVLELGIVAHSVIIGVSLGVSNSPCTIRPLFGALCFHQFFEGFVLGGCISQITSGWDAYQSSAICLNIGMTSS